MYHSQRGYQLIHHIRRATGSDVEGSRRALGVLMFTDQTGYKVFTTKIESSLLPPVPHPKLRNPPFSFWSPPR